MVRIFVQFPCLGSYRNDQTCNLACLDVGVREIYKVASKSRVFQTSFFFYLMQLHQEMECPVYPVVCDKCNKDGIPRAKVSGPEIKGFTHQ